jgi:hypothetical protein
MGFSKNQCPEETADTKSLQIFKNVEEEGIILPSLYGQNFLMAKTNITRKPQPNITYKRKCKYMQQMLINCILQHITGFYNIIK